MGQIQFSVAVDNDRGRLVWQVVHSFPVSWWARRPKGIVTIPIWEGHAGNHRRTQQLPVAFL